MSYIGLSEQVGTIPEIKAQSLGGGGREVSGRSTLSLDTDMIIATTSSSSKSMLPSIGTPGGVTSVGGESGIESVASTPKTPGGSRGKWNADEDELLREAVNKYGGRNWKRISEAMSNVCTDGKKCCALD